MKDFFVNDFPTIFKGFWAFTFLYLVLFGIGKLAAVLFFHSSLRGDGTDYVMIPIFGVVMVIVACILMGVFYLLGDAFPKRTK